MAEFEYLIKKEFCVKCFVFPPDAGKTAEIPFGGEYLSIPILKSVEEAMEQFPEINTGLVYVAPNRATQAAMDLLNQKNIKLVSMITEGVPEKDAKLLIKHAKKVNKVFNGPSAIGIISAGQCRLGVVGGEFNNLKLSKLYRPGSFGVLTKSGGLTNELCWITSQFGDGITTAVGVGGDAYPGSDFVTYLEMFEKDPDTKTVVLVGEMGGDLEEKAAAWYGAKKRRIRLVAAIAGFCQENLPKGMKFGHAGAKEGVHGEGSARAKADALKAAGANVAKTFGALGPTIEKVYKEMVKKGEVKPKPEIPFGDLPSLPEKIEVVKERGDVFVEPLIRSGISDDRGDEPLYLGYAASELIDKGYDIPHVIGLLWAKRIFTKKEAELVRRIIILSADHGPCVSGAFATILGACAGLSMSSAVAAGTLMIGPRFGGAVTDAGRYFKFGLENFPHDIPGFLAHMKKNVGPVPGIGHRVKSAKNPDKRVKALIAFVKEEKMKSPCLTYALEVEKVTLTKKDNLILNVDGCIGAVLTDLGLPVESLNGFFILARTIGFIGHYVDQVQNGSRLIRLFNYLVNYVAPKQRPVPPLK
jgi:ATP-citrate lyase alpha-subunit